jgi:hypothetical protein
MAIMKKGMGKPVKKAQNGLVTKKKPAKTYPILSEEGDLADALNETERMRAAGKVPKAADAMKQVDKWNKEGKLGPKAPKKKMGGAVKKAQMGGKMNKSKQLPAPTPKPMPTIKKAKAGFDLNKDGKTTFKDVLIGRGVLPKTAKSGTSMKKCKYGCK